MRAERLAKPAAPVPDLLDREAPVRAQHLREFGGEQTFELLGREQRWLHDAPPLRPRLNRRGRSEKPRVRKASNDSPASELFPQLVLGLAQGLLPAGRKVLAGAVDVERQHRKR